MSQAKIDSVVKCMTSNNDMSNIQSIQTKHRFKLVEFWKIKEGSKVLEIGCGQGDTTAVLAYTVGENGYVHGIDNGSRDYGSPLTLGQAADHLLNSPLGNQIKMDFEIDILSSHFEFPSNTFDYIVLSHCSWYLSSTNELNDILKKIKKWGKTLCFAEWDTRISEIEQYPHLLSILIQAQYESFKQNSDSNIRTLFNPNDIKAITGAAGWTIIDETTITSPDLQDGKWEVYKTIEDIDEELSKIQDMPAKLKNLIQSEMKMLEDSVNSNEIKPLSIFAFVAE